MKAERSLVLVLGAVTLFLFAVPALAGDTGPAECTATIEVNALRGGSPTLSNDTPKNITAKARITKGSGPPDQTVNDTVITIQAFEGGTDNAIGGPVAVPGVFTLVVGKGGQGGKVGVTVPCTPDDVIDYRATFMGNDSVNGEMCSFTSRALPKTCNTR